MYDICCIGHITSDKVVTPKSVMHLPGGTAWYFSFAIQKMDVKYLLVTSLAQSEKHYVDELREVDIDVNVQYGANTVYFENIYGENHDERTQNVLAEADPFSFEQVKDIDAKIFHLGPLLAEDIPVGFVKELSAKGKISLDVQGYLRKVENKKVYAAGWPEKREALQYVDILKADVAELQALTGQASVEDGVKTVARWGVKEIVVTNGSKGSQIFHDAVFYDIPAYPPQNIVDATGCGDTYMAGYLYKRSKSVGIQQSGEFAAAMAGLKTAAPGPFTGDEKEILSFMKQG